MTLLVDIGNARFKWARVRRGELAEHGEAAYDAEIVAERLDGFWGPLPAPQRVLGANVAGSRVAEAVTQWVARAWGARCEFVSPQARGHGVVNAYGEPGSLGADRWAALVGARRRFEGPLCVVDCGTALTIDVLTGEGHHLGGLIVPGVGLMRRAIVASTRIRDVSEEFDALLARSTPDAVAAGALHAAVGVVERIVAGVSSELGTAPTCVLTGGDAGRVRPWLGFETHHAPRLVLEGLAVIAGETT